MLRGKTVFITGASRGIGLAIALRLAAEGANIAIAAKTAQPHAKLPGTIYTAAEQIEKAGGQALPLVCDIRFEDQVQKAIEDTVAKFGGIDILVNNASAISLTDTEQTSVKKYDLMTQVNGRGTWMTSKLCLPYLKESHRKGRNPHIVVLAPPPDLRPMWFGPHTAYTMAKYAMSLCVIGLAAELEGLVAVNGLWPMTAIETSAMHNVIDTENISRNRKVEIMSDACFVLLHQPVTFTGHFCIDEILLRHQGVLDFSNYRVEPACKETELSMDFFLPEQVYGNPLTNHGPLPKQVLPSKL